MDFKHIINELNNKFSINLSKTDELVINQLFLELLTNTELKNKVKLYSLEEFKPNFKKALNNLVIDKKTELYRFFKKIKENYSFKNTLMECILPDIYEKLKKL